MSLTPFYCWTQVNKPFLDAAIQRGDDIVLATRPDPTIKGLLTKPDGSFTGFGREVQYLKDNGYIFESTTGKMLRK